ncbi:MAG: SPASM domain-containing protein [Deltaproteobacteria bacterium]|nr:SPASM domain-containing protein [Deltaproteobacteria bacterium]
MSFETFGTCLKKIPKEICIDFSGFCEPWMNPHCTEMLTHAYDQGFDVGVFTTAAWLTFQDIDQIKHIGFKRFVVHLPDNDNLTNMSVDVRYLETIGKLLESDIVNLSFMTIGNLHENLANTFDIVVREDPVIDRAGNVTGLPGLRRGKKMKGKIRCVSCTDDLNHNVLLPNGDVALCCMDYGLQHIVGNLVSEKYLSIFNGVEYLKVKRGLIDDSLDILCRYCSNAKRKGLWGHLSRRFSSGTSGEVFLGYTS